MWNSMLVSGRLSASLWCDMVIKHRSANDAGSGLWAGALVLLALMLGAVTVQAAEPVSRTLSASSTQAQIQKALDGLSAGGEVVLESGTYAINQPIILQHDYQVL